MPSSRSSSSSPPSSNKWAALPTDLLELLVRSLQSSFDRLRFGAVCRSWRDAAAAVKRNPTSAINAACGVAVLPLMTFIVQPEGDGSVKGGPAAEAPADQVDEVAATAPVTRCFYSLSEDKAYRLQVPSESRWWRCFGSSRGWLGMVDHRLRPLLFDPVSGARVDLPSLTTLTRLILRVETTDGAGEYVYRQPIDIAGHPCTGTYLRDMFVNRLALSSSPLDPANCVVMATVGGLYGLLAYTRPGYDSWVELRLPGPEKAYWSFMDIIHHDRRRRFYAVAASRKTIAVDFQSSKDDLVPPAVETVAAGTDVGSYVLCSHCTTYLVALPCGELAQVIIYTDAECPPGPYQTELCTVHMLRPVGGGGKEWVEVDNIGDCCLFLGLNESMSLPAFEALGELRTNCIVLAGDLTDCSHQKDDDYGGVDLGTYDFEEEDAVDKFCQIYAPITPPPMWITPN